MSYKYKTHGIKDRTFSKFYFDVKAIEICQLMLMHNLGIYFRLDDDRVEHFRIYCNPDLTFYFFKDFNGKKVFNSLNELAKYVKGNVVV